MMPLFGGASPRTMQNYAMLLQNKPPAPPAPPEMIPRRRGLFGGGLTPDRLMIIGAALRDAGAGGRTDHLAQTMAIQQDQARQTREDKFTDRDRELAMQDRQRQQQQRQRLEEWAANSGNPLYQVNPEAAFPQALEQTGARDQYAWQRQYDNENPEAITPYQQRQLDLTMRGQNLDYARSVNGGGMPSLTEARQWTNSYNDDVQGVLRDLGNMRAAIPYANQVIQSRGAPTGNFRMNDVALLRAAARAQTGPGVLTESEVYGTLSPSLRQALTQNRAYVDIAQSAITPQDRLALAQYVQRSAESASGDLWRRYEDAESVLSARGVTPDNVGISAPEYIHPADMASFSSRPNSEYRQGRTYIAPSGRSYIYDGNGRFRYAGQQAYRPDWALGRQQSGGDQQRRGGSNPQVVDLY